DIAGMRELEGEAETRSFGKVVTTVLPIGHIPHRFYDADRSFGIERSAKGNFRESRNRRCRILQKIQLELEVVLAGSLRDFVHERLHDERNAVSTWRAQRSSRNAIWRDLTFRYPEVRDVSSREFVRWNHRCRPVAGNIVTEGDQLAGRI